MNYRKRTALITGASAGLGEAFATQLAAQGANLVLVARSADKLTRLAETLRIAHKIPVTVLPADLSSAEAVDHLVAEIKTRALTIDILVNNAGIGLFENFLATSSAQQTQQVDLNIRALVSLTHAFAPGMVAARRGGIINLASTAAFQPLAGAAVYAASKSFVLLFSEALALELDGTGVSVTAACPGPVATDFFANMNPTLQRSQMDQPNAVVRDILHAFDQGKRVVYPGKFSNRLSTWGARLLPRNTILRLAVATTSKLNHQ
jgi:short-subunit dehydrogenase